MIKKIIITFSTVSFSLTCLAGCSLFGQPSDSGAFLETETTSPNTSTTVNETGTTVKETETVSATTTETSETTSQKKKVTELSLIAAGDNLIHDTVYEKFYEGDGIYDFRPLYEHVNELFGRYDLAVINQETIFVEDDSEIENYPTFGTPHEMGEALVDTGFDIVLSATNHTMDKGADTIEYMYDYWNTKFPDVTLLGIHGDKEDHNTIDIVEKNGIRLAMFNYTYGLNGYSLPEDREYLVDLLDNKDKFLSDVKSAEDIADMTVCFVHIGEEYVYEPTEYQKDYINDLIDAGADLVICAHPHVVEPFGEITTENGNKGIVYYSCGNFVSAQDEIDRLLGGLASVTITKTTEGDKTETVVSSYDFIPVVMHYTEWSAAVYKLEDYTDDLAAMHLISYYDNDFCVAALWELWHYITG